MKFEISIKPIAWYFEPFTEEVAHSRFILKMGLETDLGYRIMENNAKIILKRKGSEDRQSFKCNPIKRYINSNDKFIEFYFNMTLENYCKIENLRMGTYLEAYLDIEEMLLMSFQLPERPAKGVNPSAMSYYPNQFSNSLQYSIIKYDIAKLADSTILVLPDEWAEKVIKPFGMGERIILELPCEYPELDGLVYDNGELEELKNNLKRAIDKIKIINDDYRANRNHNSCIKDLRVLLNYFIFYLTTRKSQNNIHM